MYQSDLCVFPEVAVNGPFWLERVGPPWQGAPSAVERLGDDILVGELCRSDTGGCVEEMDQVVKGLLGRVQDDHAGVEQVRCTWAVRVRDSGICQLLQCLLLR